MLLMEATLKGSITYQLWCGSLYGRSSEIQEQVQEQKQYPVLLREISIGIKLLEQIVQGTRSLVKICD